MFQPFRAAVLIATLLGITETYAEDKPAPQSPAKPKPAWVTIIDHGQTNPALKGYFAPDGLKIEIAAKEPAVVNPMAMAFGDDGSLYYIHWRADSSGNSFPEQTDAFRLKDGTLHKFVTMKKGVNDQVRVLIDKDKDGVCEASAVVLPEVQLPSGNLVHDGYLYLAGRGEIRRYACADLREKDKVRPAGEVVARGFSGYHRHQVSGMVIGNDGLLYITAGDGDNVVEGSDGSRAAVLRSGAVFRCRPDGSKMQVYASGFRNPYGPVAFDAAFNLFHVDDDFEGDPRFTGCRLLHVAEDADYGWRRMVDARPGTPDPLRTALFGELPGRTPPLLRLGRGMPAGLCICNEGRGIEDRFAPDGEVTPLPILIACFRLSG